MLARWLGTLLLLVLSATPSQAETPFERLDRELTDRVVIPGYQRFAATTAALQSTLDAFCAAPAPASLAVAKAAFVQAMDAWQRVQPIGFGPIRTSGSVSAIQLFPYGRDAITRQVNEAVAAMDPALVAQGGLAGKSVALTGFPALERLLYDDDAMPIGARTPSTDYACALSLAVARNLAGIAASILEQWQGPDGYRQVVLTAGDGNEVYYDAAEVAGDFIQSLHAALDVAIAVKLEQAIGPSLDKARPKRLESWRSKLSLANMRANFETAQALYLTEGSFSDLLVARENGAALDRATRERFAGLFTLIDGIGGPLVVALKRPDERVKVEQLLIDLKALRKSLRLEIAPALDLVIGFNATDGD